MRIENNLLVDCVIDYHDIPHKSQGRNICDFVVVHFTGSHGTGNSSINWAKNPKSKVSWHLTVSRDGSLDQLANFREITWHAGRSKWYAEQVNRNYRNLNGYSIGIEIANAGNLLHTNEGWVTRLGNYLIPDEDVFLDEDGQGWEKYTKEQIEKTFELALLLGKEYNIVDILGHEEIAPGRKLDPGPAFPLKELKTKLYAQDWYKFK